MNMQYTSSFQLHFSSPSYPLMQFDYNSVVSPPLTPTVSPSNSIVIDTSSSFNSLSDRRNDTLYNNRFSTSNNSSKNILSKAPYPQHKHVCRFQFCGWSFKRYEHLKRHMLVHTGERPHLCHFPGCGKSFSRSDNFHAHYRTHTKKKLSKKRNTKATSVTAIERQLSSKFNTTTTSAASSIATNAVAAVAASQHLGSSGSVYYNTNLSNYRSEVQQYIYIL
ncbi:uncharacterized protein BX663DRAFT_567281 [Cokeromyces recurvatus]|uniref:uncharacterized protein n=1 Tax=Cokeromyces recurvatus TaxID=90255 RepID=UPI00221FBB00|nr:uncharacterized protein BX663DRAFT_567281 [Cokeromyces recurvatus]KAI7908339.1 hypothetical protein BX663DRAFT_567281 [Cokeromyces recurvatus]